jgi:paraquat-inducible protein B
MSRRVNPTLIGAFVLGAAALTVGAILVVGGRQWFKRPVTCGMAFDGSVTGLTVGAPVRFRGVTLGAVSDIRLRYGDPRIVVAVNIDPSQIQGFRVQMAPAEAERIVDDAVRKGLRAQLQLQSLLTGQLYVGLDFFPDTPAGRTGNDRGQCEIPTIPQSSLAEVQEQMKKMMAGIEQLPIKETLEAVARAGNAIEKLAASPEIPGVLRSADRTMQETQTLVRNLNAKVDPVAGSLQATLDQAQRTMDEVGRDVQRLVQDIDARVGPLADSLEGAANSAQALMRDGQHTLSRVDEEIGPTMAEIRQAAQAARDALRRADSVLGHADELLDGSSPLGYQLAESLEELSHTARALRGLSEDVERQPNLLLLGRGGSESK